MTEFQTTQSSSLQITRQSNISFGKHTCCFMHKNTISVMKRPDLAHADRGAYSSPRAFCLRGNLGSGPVFWRLCDLRYTLHGNSYCLLDAYTQYGLMYRPAWLLYSKRSINVSYRYYHLVLSLGKLMRWVLLLFLFCRWGN